MKKYLRWGIALILLTFAPELPAQDEARIAATWQVQKYDITAALPQNETDRSLTAKAKLDLKNVSQRPAGSLTLRISPAATISAISVNGTNVDFTKSEETTAGGSLQRVAVRIPSVPPAGTVSAIVDYKLTVKDNTGLNAVSPVGSQFLPLAFWYPTPNSWFFARGADHAPFRLQITAPGQKIVTSGTLSGGAFDSKYAGQPFFATGNWDVVNASGVEVYLPAGADADEQKRAAEIAAFASEARTFMQGLFGSAPESPVRIVAVKRGGGFSGNGTLLLDDGAFRRTKIDSQTAMAVADSIARIWVGGSFAIAGDGSGVIREGLPKFAATQFIEQKFGRDVADIERLRQRVAYAAVSKRDAPLTVVSPLDDYYFAEVANKSAMIWRLLAKKHGMDEFFKKIRPSGDGILTLAGVRAAFAADKEFLDHMFDQVTDTNLQAGVPQAAGAETKVALRNTGSVDATVNIAATAVSGETFAAPSTIRAKSFGEVIFKTNAKIVRVEIDSEKLYPQTEYSDDVAPREFTDSDPLLAVKRLFDKQDFAGAERAARVALRQTPRLDDVRILLARSLLAQNKNADAQKEFSAVLEEKLPTSRSLAWANVGLAEIAAKGGQSAAAVRYAEAAIKTDAEYGASLAARNIRKNAGGAGAVDESVKAFFVQFDRAATSNRKADLDALILPGEIAKFASGISGQTVEWQTSVLNTDKIDANTMLVETSTAVKLLNREAESGVAVYRLTRTNGGWKMNAVDIFEVR